MRMATIALIALALAAPPRASASSTSTDAGSALEGLGRTGVGAGACDTFAPPSGRVTLPPKTTGDLDKAAIRKVIARHEPELIYCYAAAQHTQPKLAGRLTVRFTLARDGTVTRAEVQRSTLRSRSLEACVLARWRSWRFVGPFAGAPITLTYPLQFVPAKVTRPGSSS